MRLRVDLIASSTAPCNLGPELEISPYIVAEEGYCVAVRVLEEKDRYNQVETCDGSFQVLRRGQILVGALGERQALKGYSGRIPRRIQVGDVLHVLNMGGILGQCTSDHPELGPALRVEVLGAVVYELNGIKRHARIQDHALEPVYSLPQAAPLIMVSGTAMNTGKTYAAAQIVRGLRAHGLRVAAAKLTGAALLRDVRAMREAGAVACLTFVDAGVVSSVNKNMVPIAKGLIAALNAYRPDVLVLELGDGFIGYYGVDELLMDKELEALTAAHVVAAADLAGAWAADYLFRTRYRSPITVMVGPVTDNAVGKQYIQNALGIPALNAQREPEALAERVLEALAVRERWGANGRAHVGVVG
ncbi:MAG: hypothetical protein N2561_08445 [Bacteroidetes bacterium]|nr:hypothetical protein [Rhodothermia bacterium]MCS7155363.1 hypothetical protein [Bacteroidota bacterium]MCX7907544.1 hypothetical protein [Bacteroidota bacterium]MDW8138538.1 hypothetical protein [Bacteroidota bacterium]MDW8284525.1 hypothetical protein [Bacteroidota bacterium]